MTFRGFIYILITTAVGINTYVFLPIKTHLEFIYKYYLDFFELNKKNLNEINNVDNYISPQNIIQPTTLATTVPVKEKINLIDIIFDVILAFLMVFFSCSIILIFFHLNKNNIFNILDWYYNIDSTGIKNLDLNSKIKDNSALLSVEDIKNKINILGSGIDAVLAQKNDIDNQNKKISQDLFILDKNLNSTLNSLNLKINLIKSQLNAFDIDINTLNKLQKVDVTGLNLKNHITSNYNSLKVVTDKFKYLAN